MTTADEKHRWIRCRSGRVRRGDYLFTEKDWTKIPVGEAGPFMDNPALEVVDRNPKARAPQSAGRFD